MMYFFCSCRKFCFTSSVYDMYFCTETKCGSCSIHCYVSAADNSYFLAMYDRCIVIFTECFHQVVSCQVLVCRKYTFCGFSRDSHEHRQTCTGTDEDCFKTFFIHQFINGDRTSDDHVCLDLNTECFYVFYFFCNNIQFRKTEFWNTIYQYTACLMQCFKDGYVIT